MAVSTIAQLLPITVLLQSLVPALAQQDLSCDVYADSCPTRFDGVCDRDTDEQCSGNGDCFDCDECQQFAYDCYSCLSNGCYWCPGDATCFNSDRYILISGQSSCSTADEFIQNSCSDSNENNYFQDPLYSAQRWVYDMINLQKVWNRGYKGLGVRVRINDSGVDATHPEFEGRFDLEASCSSYLPKLSETSENPRHGTAVAGIVGAAADNDLCSVGVAPEVTLSSCDVFTSRDDMLSEGQLSMYDISQNSFGENACEPRSDISGRRRQQASREMQQECPFKYDSSQAYISPVVESPCDVCESFGSGTAVTIACEMAIVRHCTYFYEEDPQGCLQFLDLLVEGGECTYNSLSTQSREEIQEAITKGRDGKGIVLVFAAGNTYDSGGDTNMTGFTNSRFILSVGAVGKDGKHASYSTPGTSLFVTAPGGDNESRSNHVTSTIGGACDGVGSGTSFACPVVSGVIALMLQANPDLHWRDVQEILAVTSQPVEDDPKDDTAIQNSAGYWHSNFYGFGIVDADAAVQAAEYWESIGSEQVLVAESGTLNLPIVDDSSVVTKSTVTLEELGFSSGFTAEGVEVLLDLEHFSRGHLEITLMSPTGTLSILHGGWRPENTQLDLEGGARWKFLTLKSWGEQPFGEWTLSIVDVTEGEVDECVDNDWTYEEQSTGNIITCSYLERQGYCVGGVINPSGSLSQETAKYLLEEYKDSGVAAKDACCVCGGDGIGREDVTDQLHKWTLAVYGRQDGSPKSATPTSSPSIRSLNPSAMTSTETPTDTSQHPTSVSSHITNIPTTSPTFQPLWSSDPVNNATTQQPTLDTKNPTNAHPTPEPQSTSGTTEVVTPSSAPVADDKPFRDTLVGIIPAGTSRIGSGTTGLLLLFLNLLLLF